MPPVRFEPTISAGERPQIYALDRTVTGTAIAFFTRRKTRRKTIKFQLGLNFTELHGFCVSPAAGTARSVQRLGYGLDGPDFDPSHVQEADLFTETSSPALKPTRPPT